jgi:Leucine-rich repeat (LRR) protein
MTGSLEIEYKATKLAIVEETDRQSASFYTLRYQQGNLASLPENICQFPNIVIIDFSKNKLKDLTNLCCLKLLDTLNLSKKHISKNTSFLVFLPIIFTTFGFFSQFNRLHRTWSFSVSA